MHHGRLERGDSHRVILESDIGAVTQVVRLPPCLLLGFGGQVPHVIALGVVGNAVEVAEVPDVPGGGNAVTGLHTTQLAHREHELLGSLLDRKTFFGPELAQQGSQLATANRGTAPFRHESNVLPQELYVVAHNPGPMVPTLGIVRVTHARCTLVWHLPSCIARCTMKSDRRSHPQATRRQRGRRCPEGLPTADRVPPARPAPGDRSRPPWDLAT